MSAPERRSGPQPGSKRAAETSGGIVSNSLRRSIAVSPHVWATPVRVLGTRGRIRLVLVVNRCGFGCGHAHVHSGPVDFAAGRRKSGCGAGSYVVHALAEQVAA